MDTKQINFILTIAEEGGITKAANKLFISQSALDQQLLKLKNELGTQLFFVLITTSDSQKQERSMFRTQDKS